MLVTKQVALRRITSVLNKGASVLERADKKFTRSLVLEDNGGDDKYAASGLIEDWLNEVAKVCIEVFGVNLLPKYFVDAEVASHDIYGTLLCCNKEGYGGVPITISYDMNWNDMSKHEIILDFSDDTNKSFVWGSGSFDPQKYKKYVADCMERFSENGFGGPGSPSFAKYGS